MVTCLIKLIIRNQAGITPSFVEVNVMQKAKPEPWLARRAERRSIRKPSRFRPAQQAFLAAGLLVPPDPPPSRLPGSLPRERTAHHAQSLLRERAAHHAVCPSLTMPPRRPHHALAGCGCVGVRGAAFQSPRSPSMLALRKGGRDTMASPGFLNTTMNLTSSLYALYEWPTWVVVVVVLPLGGQPRHSMPW
jgi:hypothetical protein